MDEGGKDIKISVIPEGDDKKKKPDTLKVIPDISFDPGLREQEEQRKQEDIAKVRENLDDVSDPRIEDETANLFVEALSQPDVAQHYLTKYEQEYGRKDYPSEAERLAALKPFVKTDLIEEKKKKSLNPGVIRKFSPASRRKVSELKQGLEAESQAVSAANNNTQLPENWSPYIIGSEDVTRPHADGGSYHYLYDQFGNTYFISPDHSSESYADLMSQHFNVNKHVPIKVPSERGFRNSKYIRFLAESSRTINSEDISAEDCDNIDPLPVTDPKRSFVSSAMLNLLSGAYDTVVRISRYDKNQIVRKDGTYYLFDLDTPTTKWNQHFAGEQFDEIGIFLRQIEDEQEHGGVLDYMAKTAVMISSLEDTRDSRSYDAPIFRAFAKRFSDEIGRSSVDRADRVGLTTRIKHEMQTVIEAGKRDNSIPAQQI